jgi:hypothetical protein
MNRKGRYYLVIFAFITKLANVTARPPLPVLSQLLDPTDLKDSPIFPDPAAMALFNRFLSEAGYNAKKAGTNVTRPKTQFLKRTSRRIPSL